MSTRSTPTQSFVSTLAGAATACARRWQHRRMVGRLSALDDYLLADMGISRQDVLSALAEPAFVDASEKLAERASASRRARRSLARDMRAEAGSGDRRAA